MPRPTLLRVHPRRDIETDWPAFAVGILVAALCIFSAIGGAWLHHLLTHAR